MDTIFHNLLSSLSIHIINHSKDYLNDARLGNGCHYFGMLISCTSLILHFCEKY